MRGKPGRELRDAHLLNHLHRAIGPGPSMPGPTNVPGKSVAEQAKALNYKDMYRNIQAMREAAYKRQRARGEFAKEFTLSGYLGEAAKTAAKKTAPGLLVAAAGVGLYLWYTSKQKAAETPEPLTLEPEEAPEDVGQTEIVENRYYYY